MKKDTSFVKELAKIMSNQNLAYIEYSDDDFSITMATEMPVTQTQTSSVELEENQVSEEVDSNLVDLKCPLVGHFYVAKSPNDAPFVNVGDYVNKGDVIGIVQAMKVSNEVIATHSGTIKEICVKNDEFVDFDCVLMKVEQ